MYLTLVVYSLDKSPLAKVGAFELVSEPDIVEVRRRIICMQVEPLLVEC